MKLVIVESPTKAKTIGKFLGKEFRVESSYGHVRDLPKSKLGIDVDKNFEPHYIIPRKAKPNLTVLIKAAEKADEIILATDEDREGEAIAWHLSEALGLNEPVVVEPPASPLAPGEKKKPKSRKKKKISLAGKPTQRIVFHEITNDAIKRALEHPRSIDLNLVNAQQARRVLDRLVGYKLSPFLWKKVVRGLSAGRVQSVALRLIADREDEILKFNPEEYWTIAALFGSTKGEFETNLQKVNGEPLVKLGVTNEANAKKIIADLEAASYELKDVERKETNKNPLPPFTTSTLQQSASQRLGLSAKKTMYLAQRLYENGHITYMRTDSVNLSEEALRTGAAWIKENLGNEYLLPSARRFKNRSKLAQEAHEAIRPTRPDMDPIGKNAKDLGIEPDEKKLYELIWRRFVASQLPQAVFDAVRLEIESTAKATSGTAGTNRYTLVANGTTLKYDGFLKIWPMKFEEKELPALEKNDAVKFLTANPSQHFTEPPPRYNEASLIKTLEKHGIGRPSTYAPIISVIQDRNYVEKLQGRFVPTEMGTLVNKVLTENFSQIVDIEFTAKMESSLDAVAEGNETWQTLIGEFYVPFAKHLEETYETVEKLTPAEEPAGMDCEKCGKPMVIKFGRFGKFIACSGFPECKTTKKIVEPPKLIGITCPDCLVDPERKNEPGGLVERRVSKKGRARGKIFWGCSRYPDCKYATWTNPLGEKTEVQSKKDGENTEKDPEDEVAGNSGESSL